MSGQGFQKIRKYEGIPTNLNLPNIFPTFHNQYYFYKIFKWFKNSKKIFNERLNPMKYLTFNLLVVWSISSTITSSWSTVDAVAVCVNIVVVGCRSEEIYNIVQEPKLRI